MLAFAEAHSACAQSDSLLLAPGRAGRIQTGMTVDTVYRRVGKTAVGLIDLFREGHFDPAIAVRLPGATANPALVASITQWPCFIFMIDGIEVRDARFRTKEGIGVGSTLGVLRRRYDVRLSDEEGPHAWVEAQRMNFRLANGSRADSVRVTAVWLPGEDPGVVRQKQCPERGPIR
jgi:hypothetical protein